MKKWEGVGERSSTCATDRTESQRWKREGCSLLLVSCKKSRITWLLFFFKLRDDSTPLKAHTPPSSSTSQLSHRPSLGHLSPLPSLPPTLPPPGSRATAVAAAAGQGLSIL